MFENNSNPQVSIILPTYNESQNIIPILESIKKHLPSNLHTEAIVVDDNSPDGTGKIVEEYMLDIKKMANYTIEVIHRTTKNGLSSAIMKGIQHATGDTIIVMDSDFSHPPQVIPKLIDTLKKYQCDMVVASRYLREGGVKDWPFKRKIISKIGTLIAKHSLGIKLSDPMSGFFAFKKNMIEGISFDAIGYKLLLEILVKKKDATIKEVPYIFLNRKIGSSKLDSKIIFDYLKSVCSLYVNGDQKQNEKRKSVKFLSKAARFYTVGAIGFVINYAISLLLIDSNASFWYLHANMIGIISSMSSNFILNKVWTFNDRNFKLQKTLKQYLKFLSFSSLGALIQLGVVFWLVEHHSLDYSIALMLGVTTAAFGNYIFNKRWTFNEKILE